MEGRTHRLLFAIAAAGGILRLAIGLRDITVLDNLFIPDDTYYTLAIARSLARGPGPTVDGEVLTNGFQPLLAFLLAPIFHLTSDIDVPLRAAVMIPAVADTISIFLVGYLCLRLSGVEGAVLASAFWALSPLAVGNALNGLETSLGSLYVLAALTWWSCMKDGGPTRQWAVLGIIWGLALLARVDTSFAVAAFGAVLIMQKKWRCLATSTLSASLTVLPWWVCSIAMFGTPIPESGAAVHQITNLHKELYLSPLQPVGWMVGTLAGSPLNNFPELRDILFGTTSLILPATFLFAGVAALMIRYVWKNAPVRGGREFLAVAVAWGIAVILLYTIHVPALWFFDRYLQAPMVVLTILVAATTGLALRGRMHTVAKILLTVSVAILFFTGTNRTASYLLSPRTGTATIGLHGAVGYRQPAIEILAMLPDGAVLGSLQSGALSYYAPKGITVVNLDGVVDGRSAEAFKNGELGRYALLRGVTHFADWEFNIENLRLRGGDELARATLRLVGGGHRQGDERMMLFELKWCAAEVD